MADSENVAILADLPKLTPTKLATGLLSNFPPSLQTVVADDAQFQNEFALTVKTTITLSAGGVQLFRSDLFNAVRKVINREAEKVLVTAIDGVLWQVSLSENGGLVIIREGQAFTLPDFKCFSSNAAVRTNWFDEEMAKFQYFDASAERWREILIERPLRDDEFEKVVSDIRLTPIFVAAGVESHMRQPILHLAELVPSDVRYYERLVGAVSPQQGLMEFIETTIFQLVTQLQKRQPAEGTIRSFLLCSHPLISRKISFGELPRDVVIDIYKWLESSGDRFSQLAGVECGLASLTQFPELEPAVTRLVVTIMNDQADSMQGRLALLSGLIVLVHGELARKRVMLDRPVFWRRLAAIAHACVLERQIIAYDLNYDTFINWGFKEYGHLFFMRSFVDMREEPRWIPDFVMPRQLKPEFIGRIAGAAAVNKAQVTSEELRNALFGTGGVNEEASKMFPLSYLPGPLEGGLEAIMDVPTEIEEAIRQDLKADPLNPKSFVRLVNSTLIFKMIPQLAEFAAEALRRTKYQLRAVRLQKESFSLLSGLATVAAATRSAELACEVRILARGIRRSAGTVISPDDTLKICLIAAAAYSNRTEWCTFVGEWATELAYEDIDRESAMALHERILVLCQLEPKLWETAARAEAACAAYLGSSAA